MRVDTCGSMSLHLPGIKVMKLIKVTTRISGLVRRIGAFSVFHLKVRSYITMNIMIRVFTRFGTIWRERYVDLEGNIWVGYRSGLSKIEVATGKIFHYRADPNRVGAMSNRSVTSLYTDKQGTVWVGTYWGGKLLLSGISAFCALSCFGHRIVFSGGRCYGRR